MSVTWSIIRGVIRVPNHQYVKGPLALIWLKLGENEPERQELDQGHPRKGLIRLKLGYFIVFTVKT